MHLPTHPVTLARFAARAAPPATLLARLSFRDAKARGLFAGLAAHSMLPLERPPSAAFGLMLGLLAHAVGWPFPRGGSQRLSDALASYLRSLGGEVETGHRVRSLAELGDAHAVLLDVRLPDANGVTLAQRLRAASDRPSILLTSTDRKAVGPAIVQLCGASGFVPKTELSAAAIRRMLASATTETSRSGERQGT